MKHLILFVLLPLLVPSILCAQEILFSDDFEYGMDDAWVLPVGGWEVEDGHLQSTINWAYLYAGGDQQSDYIVSFDFEITYYGSVGFFGCFISMSDPIRPWEGATSGYLLGYRKAWGEDYPGNLFIWKIENGIYTTEAFFPIYGNLLYGVHHIKLGRIGSELVLKIWADGEIEPDWQLSLIDDDFHSGYWMPFFSDFFQGWIDNFQVEGYGTVSTEHSSWGALKALYR